MSNHNENNHHEHGHDHSHHEHSSDENSLKDPVCGMAVTSQSKHSYSLKNIAYYFCSNGCKEKFIGAPSKYLDGGLKDSESPASVAGTIYTCPMHPQIVQDEPGKCPLCGMTLVPLSKAASHEGHGSHSSGISDFKKRFYEFPLRTSS